MRFVAISDLHLTCTNPISRLDNIEETWKRKLRFVLNYCYDNEAILLLAGDIFDKPRDWKTMVEAYSLIKEYQFGIFAVFGQHDTHLYSDKTRDHTSLGVLCKTNLVWNLSEQAYGSHISTTIDHKLYIQGASYGQEVPNPVDDYFNVLVIHKNISDEPLYYGHEYTDAKRFLKAHNFDLIVCGDAHKTFMESFKGRYIVNSGPMLRLEAIENMFKHEPGFWVYDTEDKRYPLFHSIPCEPAEKVLSRDHIINKNDKNNMLNNFIESVNNPDVEHYSFEDNLVDFIKKNKIAKDVVNIISEEMQKGD
jgi:DNA repair exonuclease SbcCD nuclease subunit